jgi:hypothetical protein
MKLTAKIQLARYLFLDSLCLAGRKIPWLLKLLQNHSHYQNGAIGNDAILALLKSNRPFLVGRLGHAESVVAGLVLAMDELHFGRCFFDKVKYKIYENDEFWPVDDQLVMRQGRDAVVEMQHFDVCICWDTFMERFFSRYLVPAECPRVDFYALEPFCHATPWSSGLAGKKVLVICPYPRTVLRQYEKRKLLWPDERILPDFKLFTMKSVYGRPSAPGCATWFDALDKMYQDAMQIDFDVAILACGPFAIPLGARFKRAGRSAITMCGVTQILFGIKGKRWDDRPYVSRFYNEHWVRPDQEELPDFAKTVEKGCYL